METKGAISLGLFLCATVMANYFFKQGATSIGPITLSMDTLMKAVTTPAVVIGVFMYGIAAVAWFVSLSMVPLNIAISVSAMVYVFVVFMAFFLFKEAIPPGRWAGIFMITLGMFLIGRTA